MSSTQEQALLDALREAEQSGDLDAIEQAVANLSLYYVAAERFATAATYWRKGALLLERTTAANSSELATYLHNMAVSCLLPAGMIEEAREVLLRAKGVYSTHFKPDAELVRDVEKLLHEIDP